MTHTPSPIDSLRDILRPDQIVTEKVDTIPYACDGTAMLREVPDVVVFPDSVEQVVAIVRWASQTGTPSRHTREWQRIERRQRSLKRLRGALPAQA